MGKIEISDDLRNKLDKVLSYKSVDMGDTAVGPAPTWKPPPPQQPQQQPSQPLPPPQQPPQQPHPTPPPQYYYVKSEKNKKKKNNIKYYKITKVVFLSSIVAGIGLTLGLKIANILFF
jgi:hypothetical protein